MSCTASCGRYAGIIREKHCNARFQRVWTASFSRTGIRRYRAAPLKSKKAPQAASYEPIGSRLGKKEAPTLLYDSGSNLRYTLGCYFIGGTILGSAYINNFTTRAARNTDVPNWVAVGTAAGVCFMVVFGSWMCSKPQNMVRKIKAIPSNGTILLRIERSRFLPFLKRPITVAPEHITMDGYFFRGPEDQVKLEVARIHEKEDRESAFSTEDWLTLPFRQAGYWLGVGFLGVRQGFFNKGLMKLHVKGQWLPWKMERDKAWALDDGRYLDSLVKIKEV